MKSVKNGEREIIKKKLRMKVLKPNPIFFASNSFDALNFSINFTDNEFFIPKMPMDDKY